MSESEIISILKEEWSIRTIQLDSVIKELKDEKLSYIKNRLLQELYKENGQNFDNDYLREIEFCEDKICLLARKIHYLNLEIQMLEKAMKNKEAHNNILSDIKSEVDQLLESYK